MEKDKIDNIIDTVLGFAIVDGACSHCSDNADLISTIDTTEYIHKKKQGKKTDYDECREAIEKILEAKE